MAVSCKYGDELSGSGAQELVSKLYCNTMCQPIWFSRCRNSRLGTGFSMQSFPYVSKMKHTNNKKDFRKSQRSF
jgi:hypothetical protein